jgi:hypothetical protein
MIHGFLPYNGSTIKKTEYVVVLISSLYHPDEGFLKDLR